MVHTCDITNQRDNNMIRKSTIQKAINKSLRLYQAYDEMVLAAENCHNTLRSRELLAKADKTLDESIKATKVIVERLRGYGLCAGEIGLTPAEAEHPLFDGIESLWEIGDGTWA